MKNGKASAQKKPGISARPVAFIVSVLISAITLDLLRGILNILFSEILANMRYTSVWALLCTVADEVIRNSGALVFVSIILLGIIFLKDKTSGLIFAGIYYFIQTLTDIFSALINTAMNEFVSGTNLSISIGNGIIMLGTFVIGCFLSVLIFSSVMKYKRRTDPSVLKKSRAAKTIILSALLVLVPLVKCAAFYIRVYLVNPYVIDKIPFIRESKTLYQLTREFFPCLLIFLTAVVIIVFLKAFKDKTSVFTAIGCYAVMYMLFYGIYCAVDDIMYSNSCWYSGLDMLRRLAYDIPVIYNVYDALSNNYDSTVFIISTILYVASSIATSVAGTILFAVVYSVHNRKKKNKKSQKNIKSEASPADKSIYDLDQQ